MKTKKSNGKFCIKTITLNSIVFVYLINHLFCMNYVISESFTHNYGVNEICEGYNGRRIYLELGDKGTLQATSVKISDLMKTMVQPPNINRNEQNKIQSPITSMEYSCNLQLVTCLTCIIKVSFSLQNFGQVCEYPNEYDNCRCNYVLLTEPPYDINQFGKRICGKSSNKANRSFYTGDIDSNSKENVVSQQEYFVSKARTLLITYVFRSNNTQLAFSLDYIAERNRHELSGIPSNVGELKKQQTQIITSPFFPVFYPRDFGIEYTITCLTESCRIRLIFIDFQIAVSSTMEFFDWNGKRIEICSFGSCAFRPPIIITTTPVLHIRFYANSGNDIGYRALVSFLTQAQALDEFTSKPNTNCGGYVESLGGAITMMNMINDNNSTDAITYDCIWLIKPSNNYYYMKTHISLRVNEFYSMGDNSELTIRQGLTSDNIILEQLNASSKNAFNSKDYIVPINIGFYINLKAVFNSKSRLSIVYTAFSITDCFVGSKFLCKNHRCIPIQLHCDGFDHCGDGSDEPDSCTQEWNAELMDKKWYSHIPNYYFPKNEKYRHLQTATFVFIVSSFGLIILIAALIVLLFKIGNRSRRQRDMQNHLETISDILEIPLDNTSQIEDLPLAATPPPAYEAPPEYNEIIKAVDFEEQLQMQLQQLPQQHQQQQPHQQQLLQESIEPSQQQHSLPPLRLPISLLNRSNCKIRKHNERQRKRKMSETSQKPILEVNLPSEDQSSETMYQEVTASTSTNQINENISEGVVEDNSSIGILEDNSSMQILLGLRPNSNVGSRRNSYSIGCQTNIIPESPPPAYNQGLGNRSKNQRDVISDIEDVSVNTNYAVQLWLMSSNNTCTTNNCNNNTNCCTDNIVPNDIIIDVTDNENLLLLNDSNCIATASSQLDPVPSPQNTTSNDCNNNINSIARNLVINDVAVDVMENESLFFVKDPECIENPALQPDVTTLLQPEVVTNVQHANTTCCNNDSSTENSFKKEIFNNRTSNKCLLLTNDSECITVPDVEPEVIAPLQPEAISNVQNANANNCENNILTENSFQNIVKDVMNNENLLSVNDSECIVAPALHPEVNTNNQYTAELTKST